jgi:hypothetical protein
MTHKSLAARQVDDYCPYREKVLNAAAMSHAKSRVNNEWATGLFFRNELRLRQKKWKIHNKIAMIKEKNIMGSVHHFI